VGGLAGCLSAQGTPEIRSTTRKATIEDGENVKLPWTLDPKAQPDVYYVNTPRRDGQVTFRTDQGEIHFRTKYGKTYDFVVVVNGNERCLVRIAATAEPTPVSLTMEGSYPQTIPFTLEGSRVYLKGRLNGQHEVNIQLDLGAGTCVVSNASSEKLGISFDGKATVSNTQGVNQARRSSGNALVLGGMHWSGVPLVEVGNMQPGEDLIIGNGLFRDKVIEIDYDRRVFIVHDHLPAYAKGYVKQAVVYEQNRPKFKAEIVQDGKRYSSWFLFDTGREGTMVIGEDFTRQGDRWAQLKELQVLNGRKIVQLDAWIAGTVFKDIVTNAADPAKPTGRPTLFGNQVLNHFNVILDNRKGELYLKPNGRGGEPYADYARYLKDIAAQGAKPAATQGR
jgi:hypothetical protein